MQKLFRLLLALALIFVVAGCSADTLNIYEKPDTHSKIIATAKSGDNLIAIFYTDKKDWIKVANPKNGEVGWVKASEIKGPIITQSSPLITDLEKSRAAIQDSMQKMQDTTQKVLQDIFKGVDQMIADIPTVQPVVVTPDKAEKK